MNEKNDTIISVRNLSKKYVLGQIGSGTLTEDFQEWWAGFRRKVTGADRDTQHHASRTKEFLALDNVSFDCRQGEKIGILGHNGAGKSTLLKLLCGITEPSSGMIEYYGKISSMLEIGTGFHLDMTGRENIYLNGAILGMSIAEIDKKVDQIVEFSECQQFIDTPVKRYSSGMFVKLAFAVASHLKSNIVIMDEVLAVGDVQFQKKCIDRMTRIATEDGRCVLFVSHNMQMIKQFCNRCIVLENGKIIFDGNVDAAIGHYLYGGNNLSAKYELDSAVREREPGKARLLSLEFAELGEPGIGYGEDVTFNLEFKLMQKIDKPVISIAVQYLDGTLLASSTSDIICDAEVGEAQTRSLKMSLKPLVPGIYFLIPRIMSRNQNGELEIEDTTEAKIKIEKKGSDDNCPWWRAVSGYVDLGRLEIMKVD